MADALVPSRWASRSAGRWIGMQLCNCVSLLSLGRTEDMEAEGRGGTTWMAMKGCRHRSKRPRWAGSGRDVESVEEIRGWRYGGRGACLHVRACSESEMKSPASE
eukprot:241349-Pleurochrysis_carterae.AAC.1